MSDIRDSSQDKEYIIGESAVEYTFASCTELGHDSIDSLSVALLLWEVMLFVECAKYITLESEIIRLCESSDTLLGLES